MKEKLGGKEAAAVAGVEADPARRSAPTRVTAMLQDLLEAKPALAGELRRILDGGGGVQAITQTADVEGDYNTTVQIPGGSNTVVTGR